MDKYPDCASCAFGEDDEPGICDMCDDGDQWEPADDYDFAAAGSRNVIKIKRIRPTKREEERAAA